MTFRRQGVNRLAARNIVLLPARTTVTSCFTRQVPVWPGFDAAQCYKRLPIAYVCSL